MSEARRLTAVVLAAAMAVACGRSQKQHAGQPDVVGTSGNRVAESLAELLPSHPQYTRLRDALRRYREIQQQGGWPMLPASLTLKPGQESDQVPLLAKRLAITGDYTGSVSDGDTVYAPALQEAVKRFQRRHGLADTGTIAQATIAQMNVPVERRIDQILVESRALALAAARPRPALRPRQHS